MSDPIVKGDPSLIELEPERSYSARDGWRSVRRWRGSKQAVNGFIPTLLVDGFQIRIVPDEGPNATIEAWFDNAQDGADVTADAQIVTTWFVLANAVEQHITESAKFTALGDTDEDFIRAYLDDFYTYAEVSALVSAGDATEFVKLINQGKTSYEISQIVLRRIKIMSGYASAVALLSNSNKVYSRAQIISAFSPPSAVQSEMPAAGEWLARNGTKEQLANGKWQVTLEFWHGDYISFVYPRVT